LVAAHRYGLNAKMGKSMKLFPFPILPAT